MRDKEYFTKYCVASESVYDLHKNGGACKKWTSVHLRPLCQPKRRSCSHSVLETLLISVASPDDLSSSKMVLVLPELHIWVDGFFLIYELLLISGLSNLL